MTGSRFLTDEHVPGAFVAALRSLGHDVVRAKDELPEGSDDARLLTFAEETGRIVVTCDMRFTLIDGVAVTDHAGVIHADQVVLQAAPEDAASGVDRIVSIIPTEELPGSVFYLSNWLERV